MADHGGYRRPSQPASVSGPGKYSRRTDGQVMSTAPDLPYGEKKAEMNAQRVAPMAGQAPPPKVPQIAPQGQQGAPQQPAAPQYGGGPFNAPTSRPNEPVTAGAPVGDGPGPEALSFTTVTPSDQKPDGSMTNLLRQLSVQDTNGAISKLLNVALAYGA